MPRPSISLIAAVDRRGGIGRDNALLLRLPEDLAHFKRTTLGAPVVMGRKTFDSIGRALPGRRNIVITRNAGWSHAGVEAAGSLDAALALLAGERASIIGGAQIFNEAIDIADEMIVTEIAHAYACDTFFPAIDPATWAETAREAHHADGVDFAFVTYQRK
jgi:dihydrofolate reductase